MRSRKMAEELNGDDLESPITSEEIKKIILQLFGEEIAKAFEGKSAETFFRNKLFEINCSCLFYYLTTDEEINCPLAITDLLERDADSQIFIKLGLTYGKALRFKREFEKVIPRAQRVRRNSRNLQPRTPTAKPSMGDLASFSPELRRLYLSK